MTQSDLDPTWRETIAAVLRDWEERGLAGPDWSVEHDVGDGCYRSTFTAPVNTPGVHLERRYSFTEDEFCQYVLGAADLAPHRAGPAPIRLAEASREEV